MKSRGGFSSKLFFNAWNPFVRSVGRMYQGGKGVCIARERAIAHAIERAEIRGGRSKSDRKDRKKKKKERGKKGKIVTGSVKAITR